jgi:hypothetical protein
MRDTIDMAREAGENIDKNWLERFAALVRADEREACAKVCEDEDVAPTDDPIGIQWCIAKSIRSRGQHENIIR